MPHSVTLTWTPSVDAVQSYNVYRGVAAGAEAPQAINAAPITADTFVDETIPSPGIYFYNVTSVENGAESLHSAEISAVVLPLPPTNILVTAIV